MPEEINRVVADHLSSWLFAPSAVSVRQLVSEGIAKNVYEVGDIMADSVRMFAPLACHRSDVVKRLGLAQGKYFAATVHRAANTDDAARLADIIRGFQRAPLPVVLPLHPRTRAALHHHGLDSMLTAGSGRVVVTEPLGYIDMLQLQQNACAVLTDSGGIQKEAYYLGVPCVTLRDETEWCETVETGWNQLVGVSPERLRAALEKVADLKGQPRLPLYGDGHTAENIVEILNGGQPRC
jgi:UDP-N-acetylglucosamine 2-epimerase